MIKDIEVAKGPTGWIVRMVLKDGSSHFAAIDKNKEDPRPDIIAGMGFFCQIIKANLKPPSFCEACFFSEEDAERRSFDCPHKSRSGAES